MRQCVLALSLVGLLIGGCSSNDGGPPRIGTGGSGGSGGSGASGGAGGTGGTVCSCPVGEECDTDGSCVSICGAVAACVQGVNAFCCPSGTVCDSGTCVTDCGGTVVCNGTCCEAGEICLDGTTCAVDCAATETLCGVDNDLCCDNATEACLNDQCVPLGNDCTFSEDCAPDEICLVIEEGVSKCVDRSAIPECIFVPPVGVFTPQTACQWQPPTDPGPPGCGSGGNPCFAEMKEVVMTPSVANMTDDNDDGKTEQGDMPDIVFVSFDRALNGCCTAKGVVQVVSGGCNPDGSMSTHATLRGQNDDWIGNSTGIALGNLHPGPTHAGYVAGTENPEIVATKQAGGTVAWRRTSDDGSSWEVMWQNDAYVPIGQLVWGGAQPSIADIDADGQPEVIIGNVVLNGNDGSLKWDGTAANPTETVGVGNNAFLGPVSTVADLDLDGQMEVIAGNTVYNVDGSERWTYTYTTDGGICHLAGRCDGYNGVGNFDDDDEGEVVIVRQGEVFVFEHDGGGDPPSPTHQLLIPWDNCTKSGGQKANESGPPTIADFDGDGKPEIGTAGADFYVLIDLQCEYDAVQDKYIDPFDGYECYDEFVRWAVPNQDCSSRATASSVFDFEGDGKAEVVYADETNFRVFSGIDGTILFDDPSHSSNTRVEMPIVVDVDNDGKSEIVVPEPNHSNDNLGGIEVWEDVENNWVRTRRVWNQHSYHVSNITEDGQVPVPEPANWCSYEDNLMCSLPDLNNFRQNVQPSGLFDAPDFVIRPPIVRKPCTGDTTTVSIVVGNDGALSVPPGINVFVEVSGSITEEHVLQTTGWLLPGQSEELTLELSIPESTTITVQATIDEDGDGNAQYNECDETNNTDLSNSITSCQVG